MGQYDELISKLLSENKCNVCANQLKPGDKVVDINKGCSECNARGTVKSIKKIRDKGGKIAGNLVDVEVKNYGKTFKPGDRIKKTEIQLKKI